MGTRTELHEILIGLFEEGQEAHVYFQPPSNLDMKYPCIIYNRDDIRVNHANNAPYKQVKRYQLTVVYNSGSEIALSDKVSQLPMCSFDRAFTADQLYHDVYDLYF